jgi:hypothetical protein
MHARALVCSTLGLLATSSLTGCLAKHDWSTEFADKQGGLELTSTSRTELESRRGKAIGSGDVPTLTEYMAYLWQFEREHRDWLALVDVGKSPRLPEALAGFDRKTYTDEVIAAWMAVRPAELPRSADRVQLLQADFYATALTGGCRDTARAMGPLLMVIAEGESVSVQREAAILESECGHEDGNWTRACEAAGKLLVGMPEPAYDDLDGDMWPDPSLRVRFAELCPNALSKDDQAIVNEFHRGAEAWFAEHHPEEHAAWRAEMARLAAARREAEARAAAEREAEAAAYSSSSSAYGGSSAPAGGGVVNVRLYNACSQTVRLFFGDKPGFSSGTETSLSSNTSTSYSMREGDMIWIVIDGRGASSYSASAGNSSIQITSSCGGFAPR